MIFGIVPRPLRHHRGERLFQFRHTVTGQRRDEIDFGKLDFLAQLLRERQHRFLHRLVDLVDHEDLALGTLFQRFQHGFQLVPPLLDRIDQQEHRIGGFRAFPSRAHHGAVEFAARGENTRRVDQDHLCFGMERNAQHPRAGGLRLGAGDCDLLPDQLVHQRAFARIGCAKNGDDAAFLGGITQPNCSINFSAASFSASLLLLAVAVASPTLRTLTRTVNCAA